MLITLTRLSILIGLMALWSCGSDQNAMPQANVETPDTLLDKEQMVALLIDIHLAEAQIPYYNFNFQDSSKALYWGFEKKLYKKYGIDSITYQKNFDYYLHHIEDFNEIYGIVLDSLKLRESMLNLGKPIDSLPPQRKDTVSKTQRLRLDSLENLRKDSLSSKWDSTFKNIRKKSIKFIENLKNNKKAMK